MASIRKGFEPAFGFRFGLMAVLGLVLAGCQDLTAPGDMAEATTVKTLETPDGDLIEETIKTIGIPAGDDLYMIPSGLDDDGCEMFRPYSTVNPVKTAIHYRQADGGFGIAKDPAVCKVEMVAVDPDGEGCPRFRAQPVGGSVPEDQQTLYYQKGDGTYSVHKTDARCS